MTALRFQTGGRHQTSPASLRGRDNYYDFGDDNNDFADDGNDLIIMITMIMIFMTMIIRMRVFEKF